MQQQASSYLACVMGIENAFNLVPSIFSCLFYKNILNHFNPLFSISTSIKTSENQKLSDVFRGYRKRTLA